MLRVGCGDRVNNISMGVDMVIEIGKTKEKTFEDMGVHTKLDVLRQGIAELMKMNMIMLQRQQYDRLSPLGKLKVYIKAWRKTKDKEQADGKEKVS
jgi:hypothetical protein